MSHERTSLGAAKTDVDRWRHAVEGNGDGVWDWDALTGEAFYSDRWKALLGYESHEIPNCVGEWSARVHPDDRDAMTSALNACIDGKTEVYQSEHRVRRKDGSWRWFLDRGRIVSRTEDGRPRRFVGTLTDITERHTLEERVRLQAKRLEVVKRIIELSHAEIDLERLFRSVFDLVVDEFGFEGGGAYLRSEDGTRARLLFSSKLPRKFVEQAREVSTESPPYDVVFRDRIILSTSFVDEENTRSWGFTSVYSIPVIAREVAVGALNVVSARNAPLSSTELSTLTAIGLELGAAAHNLENERALREVRDNLDQFYNSITDLFFVISPSGRILDVNAVAATRLAQMREELIGRSIVDIHLPARREEARQALTGMREGITAICNVPLVSSAGEIIEVESRVVRGTWSGEKVFFGVARDVGVQRRMERAIREKNEELESLNRRLAEQAITDGLTGLHNHTHVLDLLDEEVARARRYVYPISVLMVDVDHFKQVNDTYGHAVGDAVLSAVGRLLRESVRAVDFAGRYGGEEFLFVLTHTDENAARLVAERIRENVSRLTFSKNEVDVTVSIGVAGWDGESGQALVARADARLYRAKEHGRNRVEGGVRTPSLPA